VVKLRMTAIVSSMRHLTHMRLPLGSISNSSLRPSSSVERAQRTHISGALHDLSHESVNSEAGSFELACACACAGAARSPMARYSRRKSASFIRAHRYESQAAHVEGIKPSFGSGV
jgi:hypothetical protein